MRLSSPLRRRRRRAAQSPLALTELSSLFFLARSTRAGVRVSASGQGKGAHGAVDARLWTARPRRAIDLPSRPAASALLPSLLPAASAASRAPLFFVLVLRCIGDPACAPLSCFSSPGRSAALEPRLAPIPSSPAAHAHGTALEMTTMQTRGRGDPRPAPRSLGEKPVRRAIPSAERASEDPPVRARRARPRAARHRLFLQSSSPKRAQRLVQKEGKASLCICESRFVQIR